MLSGIGVEHVYLACGATDLRKSVDGLAAIVQYHFALDPFAPALFVFCNRHCDRLKILYWEHNGFWLFYRRLESGRFRWPQTNEGTAHAITRRQLQWLLAGLEIEQKKAHPALTARTIL